VQKVAPGAVIVGAFQNLPAAALGDLGCSLNADVLITSDDAAAVRAVIDLTARVAGLEPIDAGGLANTAGVEALTPILINVNRKRKGEHSVRLVDLHGTH
jgi:predicted dinucleotide-binding enzyme